MTIANTIHIHMSNDHCQRINLTHEIRNIGPHASSLQGLRPAGRRVEAAGLAGKSHTYGIHMSQMARFDRGAAIAGMNAPRALVCARAGRTVTRIAQLRRRSGSARGSRRRPRRCLSAIYHPHSRSEPAHVQLLLKTHEALAIAMHC